MRQRTDDRSSSYDLVLGRLKVRRALTSSAPIAAAVASGAMAIELAMSGANLTNQTDEVGCERPKKMLA